MMWKNWNKADKTLLAAAAVFFFSLCLRLQYPESLLAQGMLFCAEAALVGGIADWFAVTALFEKPLGFPYHTAILPRRRAEFIAATGRMLQQEFFSRKKLVGRVRNADFAEIIALWLKNEEKRVALTGWLTALILKAMAENRPQLAAWLEKQIVERVSIDSLVQQMPAQLENSDWYEDAADKLLRAAVECVRGDSFRAMLESYLERYQEEKLNSTMAKMMAGLAASTGLLNLGEAAQITQEQLLEVLERALQPETEERELLLDSFISALEKILIIDEVKQDFRCIWQNIASGKLGITVTDSVDFSQEGPFSRVVSAMLDGFLRRVSDGLLQADVLRARFNGMCYQLCAKGVLQAQDMLTDIANEVLGGLTDEQMKHLIYDKVEPDLLWIRMNGSIVGAVIGLMIFLLGQLTAAL